MGYLGALCTFNSFFFKPKLLQKFSLLIKNNNTIQNLEIIQMSIIG